MDSPSDAQPFEGPDGWIEQRIPDAGDRRRRIFIGRTEAGWYTTYIDSGASREVRFDSTDEFVVRDQAALYLVQYAPHEIVSWTSHFNED